MHSWFDPGELERSDPSVLMGMAAKAVLLIRWRDGQSSRIDVHRALVGTHLQTFGWAYLPDLLDPYRIELTPPPRLHLVFQPSHSSRVRLVFREDR